MPGCADCGAEITRAVKARGPLPKRCQQCSRNMRLQRSRRFHELNYVPKKRGPSHRPGLICRGCGVEFVGHNNAQKYCTLKCQHAASHRRAHPLEESRRTCRVCGAWFVRPAARRGRRYWCSDECREISKAEWAWARRRAKGEVPRAEYYAAIASQPRKPRNQRPLTCRWCSDPYVGHKDSAFCSVECRQRWRVRHHAEPLTISEREAGRALRAQRRRLVSVLRRIRALDPHRVCLACNTPFLPERRSDRFCGDECRMGALAEALTQG